MWYYEKPYCMYNTSPYIHGNANRPYPNNYVDYFTSLRQPVTITYIVKQGDTLGNIAWKYNTTVQRIVELNNLTTTVIYPGQQLLVSDNTEKIYFNTLYDTDTGKNISIWKVKGKETAFFFTSKMAIDADGARIAYHPNESLGLDYLYNAGSPGKWYGIVTDPDGDPMLQNENDVAPGFFVSPTTLLDCNKSSYDSTAYVDSMSIPYFVLPHNNLMGAVVGDIGLVMNRNNGKMSYAIFADTGPANKLGEGSIALANALDINPSPKVGGTSTEMYVFYLVFTGSGQGPCKLRTLDEINANGRRLFQEWGGMEQLKSVL